MIFVHSSSKQKGCFCLMIQLKYPSWPCVKCVEVQSIKECSLKSNHELLYFIISPERQRERDNEISDMTLALKSAVNGTKMTQLPTLSKTLTVLNLDNQ